MILVKCALFIILVYLIGCSPAPVRKEPIESSKPKSQSEDSSVEILYTLGHSKHRFYAESKGGQWIVQDFRERQLLEQLAVDQAKYSGFLKKASSFLSDVKRSAQQQQQVVPCRTPFTVVVKIGQESKSSSGCRSSDDGSFSHLIQDGESMLYSR